MIVTTENLLLIAGGPISWLSKKQATVSLSTYEAEYVALSAATQEVRGMAQKVVISDLNSTSEGPTYTFGRHVIKVPLWMPNILCILHMPESNI